MPVLNRAVSFGPGAETPSAQKLEKSKEAVDRLFPGSLGGAGLRAAGGEGGEAGEGEQAAAGLTLGLGRLALHADLLRFRFEIEFCHRGDRSGRFTSFAFK